MTYNCEAEGSASKKVRKKTRETREGEGGWETTTGE